MSVHPNQEFARQIMQHIDNGVPIYYDGPDYCRIYKNWLSCKKLSNDVVKSIKTEVDKGRKIGPFTYPPFSNFVGSPMGAFEKSSHGNRKVRVITDLSWPPGEAVNSFISKDVSRVSYVTIDTAVAMVKECGKNSNLFKIDLSDAYRQIVVQPKDWHLLGSTWSGEDGNIEYYVDTRLSFGLRSSARLFDNFAAALEFMMLNNGTSRVIHYLDDYFSCSPADVLECENNKNIMLQTCAAAGLEVNMKKVIGPVTTIEFLGIIIDSEKMELRLSGDRVNAIKAELLSWIGKNKGTKRQLLSLLGKLTFLSRIVRPGRIFTRRLIECVKKLKQLHHKTRLSVAAKKDILWWLEFIDDWNAKSVFYEDQWLNAHDINFFTDSSDIGWGAVCMGYWSYGSFQDDQKKKSIEWRELYAVVKACSLWGRLFIGKKIFINCDNMSIVYAVNSGASKSSDIMELIRQLFFIASTNSFECRLVHVDGATNVAADMLSRQKISKFKELFPYLEYNRC